VLVDPVPYVDTVANLATTAGGLAREDDESLAERIYLAPANYSVAGPQAAYEYFVKEAYPAVADVAVTSPDANEIDIRVIGENGEEISEDMCEYIEDYLMNGQIKPMGDTVTVSSPTAESYDIGLTYYINRSDSASVAVIQAAVESAVDEYVKWQAGKIGRDIEPNKLIEYVMAAGVKRVVVTAPTYTTIGGSGIAALDERSVTYGGLEDD
jgi:phage-related baseplate assembly protein